MAPRKKTKAKTNKRVKSTHTPVSDVDYAESSRASTQDTQPASHSTLGKRNRPAIPDSDDESVTEYEIEDVNQVLSQSHIDSDLNDNVTVQPPGLSLSNPSDKAPASGNRAKTVEEEKKAFIRHTEEDPFVNTYKLHRMQDKLAQTPVNKFFGAIMADLERDHD